MKKWLLVSALVGSITLQGAQASDNESDLMQRSGPQAWQGAGIGALAGALLAGPPGLVVGAAGGALIGHNEATESRVESLADEKQQLDDRNRLLAKQLEQINRIHRERIAAITEGFFLTLHFRTDSAELEPRYEQELQLLARTLQQLPELQLYLDAHADRRGGKGFNHALSKQRAQRVTSLLQRHGVPEERIVELPHGEEGSEYPLDDAEGLDFDRRVVIGFRLKEGAWTGLSAR